MGSSEEASKNLGHRLDEGFELWFSVGYCEAYNDVNLDGSLDVVSL